MGEAGRDVLGTAKRAGLSSMLRGRGDLPRWNSQAWSRARPFEGPTAEPTTQKRGSCVPRTMSMTRGSW